MRFGSICSGIEAAWFAEIEPFPSAVLAHHYPYTLNVGDMAALPALIRSGAIEAPGLLCGGTPCQAFSVAGKRMSLDDARGNLTITFCDIADAIDEVRNDGSIIFWENVPGVLNTKDNAFGCFLGALAGESGPLEPAGAKWSNAGVVLGPKRAIAWRVLDAQYFGVAQRRRRVFVVASARDGFDPAAVLFEFDGLRRGSLPSRTEGQDAAGTIASRADGGSFHGTDGSLQWFRQPTYCIKGAAIGRKPEAGPQHGEVLEDVCYTQNCVDQHAVCFAENSRAGAAGRVTTMQVRRLTPIECERLQGFPDGYTAIPWRKKPAEDCPDGPRYKALGNSWAVPVVRWIGRRIDAIASK